MLNSALIAAFALIPADKTVLKPKVIRVIDEFTRVSASRKRHDRFFPDQDLRYIYDEKRLRRKGERKPVIKRKIA